MNEDIKHRMNSYLCPKKFASRIICIKELSVLRNMQVQKFANLLLWNICLQELIV